MVDDAPWADPVVVPDDIRALHDDIEAYYRELRTAARRRRWQRLTTSRWGLPVTVLCSALLLAVVVTGLLVLAEPQPGPGPLAPTAIAASPAQPAGSVDGLLPDIMLRTATEQPAAARDLRPALLALVPQRCTCVALLRALAGQATAVRLKLVVVAPTATDAEVAALPGQVPGADIETRYDTDGVLARTYHASGVTAVIVATNATVTYIGVDVTNADQLGYPLQALLSPTPAIGVRETTRP